MIMAALAIFFSTFLKIVPLFLIMERTLSSMSKLHIP